MNAHVTIAPVLGERRGCVIAGPHAVAFVGGDDPVAHAVIGRLVERATDSADAIEQAESLLGGTDRSHPPSVVVAPSSESVVVVHGDPGVVVHDRSGERLRRLASADGMPLRTNLATGSTVVVGVSSPAHVDESADRLVAGRLAADGFVLVADSDDESVVSMIDSTDDEARNDAPADDDSTDRDDVIDRWAAPVSPSGPPSVPAAARRLSVLGGRTSEPPSIEGIMCSRQHFNDPRARFCGSCGIAMHHVSIVMVRRPRPILGQLVFDTGETFQLSNDVVVGRSAGDDSLVAGGDARSLVPAGDTSALSRTHAEIRLSGWDAVITDRSSLNGTFVWERSTQHWRRLVPGAGETLRIGDVMAFGRRTATFESSVRPS